MRRTHAGNDRFPNLDRALALKPDFEEALNTRGNALASLERNVEALASYDRAMLKPDYVEALCNRGNALRRLGRREDALSSYDRALALRPTRRFAHSADYLRRLAGGHGFVIDRSAGLARRDMHRKHPCGQSRSASAVQNTQTPADRRPCRALQIFRMLVAGC